MSPCFRIAPAIVGCAVLIGATFPVAPRGNDSSTYFGITVADPYRSFEDVTSPRTRAWSSAENAATRSYLDALPLRKPFQRRLTRLWRYRSPVEFTRYGNVWTRKASLPRSKGSEICVRFGTSGPEHVVLNSSERIDGGPVEIDSATFRDDGREVLFATSTDDANIIAWHVRDVRTHATRDEGVTADASSPAVWSGVHGFFYQTLRSLPGNHVLIRVAFHRFGERANADRTTFLFRAVAGSSLAIAVSTDDRWLVVTTSTYGRQQTPQIWVRPVAAASAPMRELFAGVPSAYQFLNALDGSLVFLDTRSCPDTCIDVVDPKHPERLHRIIGDCGYDISGAAIIDERFFVVYSIAAHSVIREFTKAGTLVRDLHLPAVGTIDPNDVRDDGSGRALLVRFSNYTFPPTLLTFDTRTGQREVLGRTMVNYKPSDFVTEQRFVRSRDGTAVPMFVTRLRRLQPTLLNPTILYVYGGFGVNEEPVWTPEIVSWLAAGGIYAVVNARGGGEFGEAWHRAATGLHKQRSIDDVTAAAQALERSGFTDPRHLAVRGDSNGGFVAAAAALQRPDLFAALITREGLLDLVRYDVMLHGAYWADEYGSKTASKAQFANLARISPVAAVRPGVVYPAALIQTGDVDETVSPAHAFKFVATLQADRAGSNPVLLRIDSGVGHGGGESLAKAITESVDQYAFLFHVMGIGTQAAASFGI